MRPIPKKTREELGNDKFMKTCCLWSHQIIGWCKGRIEFHHNLIYGGKQSNIKETILPLCKHHHSIADYKQVKEFLNWIMLNRMKPIDILNISKAIDYVTMKRTLNKQYGNYAKRRTKE